MDFIVHFYLLNYWIIDYSLTDDILFLYLRRDAYTFYNLNKNHPKLVNHEFSSKQPVLF